MYRTVFFSILMLLGVAFGGPDPAGADDADVVAKIGERKITRAEFQEFIDATPMKGQKDLQSPTFQKDVLRTMVLRKVLADKARKTGLDKKKDTALAVENAVNTVLSSALLEEEVRKKIEVTDEDIQLYYRMHRAELKVPEQVKASHILVKVATFATEEERAKAQEKAEGLLKRIRSGEDFAELAKEFSDDPGSKKKGGDLGFFSRGKMIKVFEDAAFLLTPGEVSELVKTQFGYHIIKVEEKREAGLEPIENVRGKIKQKIFDERREIKAREYAEQALRDANAEIYPEVLDKK